MSDKKVCKCVVKTTDRSDEERKKLIHRLNRIEGQIRGIKQMINDDRYCEDILTQLSAINKAVESLENTILESHIRNCVNRELKNGNEEIINEVMELFKRLR